MLTDKNTLIDESTVTPLEYSKEDGIIAWMDCGGSNVVKINEQLDGIVKIIITTRINHDEVKAKERAEELGVPLVEIDFRKYEEEHGVMPGDYYNALKITKGDRTAKLKGNLSPRDVINVRDNVCNIFIEKINRKVEKEGLSEKMPIFAGGGMALLSKEFVEYFDILNVHPGDVSKYDLKGVMRDKRTIVGDGWIPPAKAIAAGHESLRSSMHGMIYEMDAGPIYMRGHALPIDYNFLLSKIDINDKAVMKQVGAAAQETLKHIGDHVIAGATFHDMFEGNWGMQKNNVLAYKLEGEWFSVPNGILPEHHLANNPTTPFDRDLAFLGKKIEEFHNEVYEISLQGGEIK